MAEFVALEAEADMNTVEVQEIIRNYIRDNPMIRSPHAMRHWDFQRMEDLLQNTVSCSWVNGTPTITRADGQSFKAEGVKNGAIVGGALSSKFPTPGSLYVTSAGTSTCTLSQNANVADGSASGIFTSYPKPFYSTTFGSGGDQNRMYVNPPVALLRAQGTDGYFSVAEQSSWNLGGAGGLDLYDTISAGSSWLLRNYVSVLTGIGQESVGFTNPNSTMYAVVQLGQLNNYPLWPSNPIGPNYLDDTVAVRIKVADVSGPWAMDLVAIDVAQGVIYTQPLTTTYQVGVAQRIEIWWDPVSVPTNIKVAVNGVLGYNDTIASLWPTFPSQSAIWQGPGLGVWSGSDPDGFLVFTVQDFYTWTETTHIPSYLYP